MIPDATPEDDGDGCRLVLAAGVGTEHRLGRWVAMRPTHPHLLKLTPDELNRHRNRRAFTDAATSADAPMTSTSAAGVEQRTLQQQAVGDGDGDGSAIAIESTIESGSGSDNPCASATRSREAEHRAPAAAAAEAAPTSTSPNVPRAVRDCVFTIALRLRAPPTPLATAPPAAPASRLPPAPISLDD